MNKDELDVNPIPSYIFIDEFELYVTYSGQQITCKYCGQPGHVQSRCEKRFLMQKIDSIRVRSLSQQSVKNITEMVLHCSEATDLSFDKATASNFQLNNTNDKLINLSRKSKQTSDSDIGLPECIVALPLKMPTKETLSADADPKLQSNADSFDSSLSEEETSNDKETLEKTGVESQKETNQNWWQMSRQVLCLTCRSENVVADTATKFVCKNCGEKQYVARLCCIDSSSNERFAMKYLERYAKCTSCHSEMIRSPCCEQFLPKMQLNNNMFDCVHCSRYSISCVCKNVNCLPPKTMSWKCKNFMCSQFTVHCNCGRVTFQDQKSPYHCPYGYEYEYDVETGVKTV